MKPMFKFFESYDFKIILSFLGRNSAVRRRHRRKSKALDLLLFRKFSCFLVYIFCPSLCKQILNEHQFLNRTIAELATAQTAKNSAMERDAEEGVATQGEVAQAQVEETLAQVEAAQA